METQTKFYHETLHLTSIFFKAQIPSFPHLKKYSENLFFLFLII